MLHTIYLIDDDFGGDAALNLSVLSKNQTNSDIKKSLATPYYSSKDIFKI